MKILLLLALLAPTISLATDEDFAAKKAEAAANIDQRATMLSEHKACMAAATDKAGMKACREKMKENRKGMKAEHMEKRKGKIDERIKKLEAKKAAVGSEAAPAAQ